MSTVPALLTRQSLGGTPASVPLPPGFDMDVASISAHFDGSGAGGTFLACCAFYSQDGTLVGRFFPSQQLSAGDSGEVTYGPFLEAAAAASGASGVSEAAGLYNWSADTTGNVPASTWTTLGSIGSWSNGYTTDPNASGFTVNKDTGVIATSKVITCHAVGWVQWNGAFAAGDHIFVAINLGGGIRIETEVVTPAAVSQSEQKILVGASWYGNVGYKLEAWHDSASTQSIRDGALYVARVGGVAVTTV